MIDGHRCNRHRLGNASHGYSFGTLAFEDFEGHLGYLLGRGLLCSSFESLFHLYSVYYTAYRNKWRSPWDRLQESGPEGLLAGSGQTSHFHITTSWAELRWIKEN